MIDEIYTTLDSGNPTEGKRIAKMAAVCWDDSNTWSPEELAAEIDAAIASARPAGERVQSLDTTTGYVQHTAKIEPIGDEAIAKAALAAIPDHFRDVTKMVIPADEVVEMDISDDDPVGDAYAKGYADGYKQAALNQQKGE